MNRLVLLPLTVAIASCATENLPPAPGDDGARRTSGFNLPWFSSDRTEDVRRADRDADAMAVTLLPADHDKLSRITEIQTGALFDAMSRDGINRDAQRISQDVLTAASVPFGDAGATGTYRCRTLKHGGPVPFIAYGYFDCEVRESPNGLVFEKVSGSQRMTGRLFAAPGLGANGEKALAYAGTQHAGSGSDTYPDGTTEVGLFERTGKDRYRLRIPEPGEEGFLDVIDLVRTNG